jgi:hypothetical protein
MLNEAGPWLQVIDESLCAGYPQTQQALERHGTRTAGGR